MKTYILGLLKTAITYSIVSYVLSGVMLNFGFEQAVIVGLSILVGLGFEKIKS